MLKNFITHKELNELSYMKIFVKEITDRTKHREFFTQCIQAMLTALSYLLDGLCAVGYAVLWASLGLVAAVVVFLLIILTPVWLLCDFISVSYSKFKADMEEE